MMLGIFLEFNCVRSIFVDGENFYVLVFGCCDFEDFFLKGFDIVVKVLVELNEWFYYLIVVGVVDGK